jgi:hypothetical protein
LLLGRTTPAALTLYWKRSSLGGAVALKLPASLKAAGAAGLLLAGRLRAFFWSSFNLSAAYSPARRRQQGGLGGVSRAATLAAWLLLLPLLLRAAKER